MPPGRISPEPYGPLLDSLDAIFREISESGCEERLNRLTGVFFRYGDDSDRRRIASGPVGGSRNPIPDLGQGLLESGSVHGNDFTAFEREKERSGKRP
jgi:hypothetical protein